MARLQTGDWWEYAVEGSIAREGRTMALRGAVRVTIERREAGGKSRDAIVFAPDHRIVGVDGPGGVLPMPTGVFYVEQDAATNAVCIAGDNMGPGGSDRFAVVPQVFYPGSFDAGTAYEIVLDFGPHGRVPHTLRTVGIERSTPRSAASPPGRRPISSSSQQFRQGRGLRLVAARARRAAALRDDRDRAGRRAPADRALCAPRAARRVKRALRRVVVALAALPHRRRRDSGPAASCRRRGACAPRSPTTRSRAQ